MRSLLLHSKLAVRFGTLIAVVLAVFLAIWTISYLWLPEGLLRGRSGAALLAGETAAPTFWLEWARLLAVNSALALICVVGASLVASNGIPLGYIVPVVWGAMYAVTLGTNSFSLALPGGRMAPSLTVLARSGLYEIIAYTLLAAAGHTLPRLNLQGRWPRQVAVPVERSQRRRFTREQWFGVVLAAVVLAAACAWEAYRIVNYAPAA